MVQRIAEDGTPLARYEYDAFGNQRKEANADTRHTAGLDDDPNPFRYCGEYWDADLREVYLRARTYNPGNGRFSSEDAAKDGGNWYTYCAGNPVTRTDPSGQAWATPSDNGTYYDTGYEEKSRTTDGLGNIIIEIDIHSDIAVTNVKFSIGTQATNNDTIIFDWNTTNHQALANDPTGILILANAMFEFIREYSADGLNGRTLEGVYSELRVHYALGWVGQRVREANIGGRDKGKYGYDGNAVHFEIFNDFKHPATQMASYESMFKGNIGSIMAPQPTFTLTPAVAPAINTVPARVPLPRSSSGSGFGSRAPSYIALSSGRVLMPSNVRGTPNDPYKHLVRRNPGIKIAGYNSPGGMLAVT